MKRAGARNGEHGSAVVNLLLTLATIAAAFVAYHFVAAFIDINGMESDLGRVSDDLAIECVGDPTCEKGIFAQIEAVREELHPKLEIDYSTLDYNAAANLLTMEGSRVVDLRAHKFTWRFSIRVEIMR